MKDPKRFYTYAYLREDRTPYYIGKGEGDRAFYRRKRIIKPPKDKSRIILLKQNLTEEEAFKHEKYMIAVFGRKDLGTGILRNRTDGGEGVSGLIHSEEHRRKNSEANRGKCGKIGEENPNYGKTWWTNGKNDTISFECPGEGWVLGRNTIRRGELHPFYNKRGKNSCAYGRKWWNDGCGNMKHSVECPGEGWVLGMSEERRLKTNGVNKGKKWWNDGKGNSVMSIGCPDEGWVLGRGKEIELKNCENKKDLKWWNDGCGNSKRSVECPGDGWVIGMTEETKRKRSILTTGKKWWNDSKTQKRCEECPGEGWVLGRVKNRLFWWNDGKTQKRCEECPGDGWVRGRGKIKILSKDTF